MPQMDSLRAVAVFGVLVQHWFNPALPLGAWGVRLFFVISGYLITCSLFRLRESGASLRATSWEFFVKRSTRLFPAYYMLLFLWLLMSPQLRSDWYWYFFYMTNFLLEVRQAWIPLTPSWSLAVEEQFYLVWFFIILLLSPIRWKFLVLLIALSPIARYFYSDAGNSFGVYLPWSNFDALVIGACLCLMERNQRQLPSYAAWVVGVASSFLLLVSLTVGSDTPWAAAVLPLLVAFISGYLVWRSRVGFCGLVGRILNQPALTYLGRISYGIYLYHMLTDAIAANIAVKGSAAWQPFFQRETLTGFAVHVGLTLILAAVSFRYMETPLRLKLNRLLLR